MLRPNDQPVHSRHKRVVTGTTAVIALLGAFVVLPLGSPTSAEAASRADLTVRSVTLSPTKAVSGAKIKVTAKVKNSGK